MKKDSTATDGTWLYEDSIVNCNDEIVRCVTSAGSSTLYTLYGYFGSTPPWPNGIYTCCIEGSCISTRVYQEDDMRNLFPNSN